MDAPVKDIETEEFNRRFDERFEQKIQEREKDKVPRMALIATKGTLDMAYPPWNIPNAIASNIPGFESLAASLMKKTVESKGVASIEQLRELSIEAEVKLVACQMTVDLFGHKKEDFIDEISEWVGAATFLPFAQKSDVCLFV